MPTIRNASLADAKALASLAERTFRATFGAANTTQDIALHCATNFNEAAQTNEIADPKRMTFIAEDAGVLVGFAQLRSGAPPSCVEGEHPMELQRLYVDAPWHGKGIAHEIMKACFDEAAKRNADVLWLGVWEKNPRAVSFYWKLGFVEVGEHIFVLGKDRQRDVIMVRKRAELT